MNIDNAILHIQSVTRATEWTHTDFQEPGEPDDPHCVLIDTAIATILNAVVCGDLVKKRVDCARIACDGSDTEVMEDVE